MRDPLSADGPFEVLGVGADAEPTQVSRAFNKGLTDRPHEVKGLMDANRILEDPIKRAELRLLYYQPGFLQALEPSPLRDPSVLDLRRREATAVSWERTLRRIFPDPGIVHSVAVLWYWWAAYSDPLGSREHPGMAFDELWANAISSWATLVARSDFWPKVTGLPEDDAWQVRDLVVSRIGNHLKDLTDRSQAAMRVELAERYEGLSLAFSTELQAARTVASAGICAPNGTVCSGPMMLARLGALETVQYQVDVALQRAPSNKKLQSVREALSPLGPIGYMLEMNKLDEALAALDALPADDGNSSEAQRLRTRLVLAQGEREVSLGNVGKAIDLWGTALQRAVTTEEQGKLRHAVVAACQKRVRQFADADRDQAIAMLDQALAVVVDAELTSRLADLVLRRGIFTVQAAHDLSEDGDTGPAVVEKYEAGIADLERAALLGSPSAGEQLQVARSMAEQALLGPAFGRLLEEANRAATRSPPDWGTVIDRFRAAMELAGSRTPDFVRTNLGAALANRAVARSNAALSEFKAAIKLVGVSPLGVAPVWARVITTLEAVVEELREARQLAPELEGITRNLKDIEETLEELTRAKTTMLASISGARPRPATPRPATPRPVTPRPVTPSPGPFSPLPEGHCAPSSTRRVLKTTLLAVAKLATAVGLLGLVFGEGLAWFFMFGLVVAVAWLLHELL